MKNKKYVLLLILFIVMLGAALVEYKYLSESISTPQFDNSGEETTDNSQQDFTVTDAQGNYIRLSDYSGKPVVINFWATWCGPCISELPSFDMLYKEYGEDINFLMINMTDSNRDTFNTVGKYISENGYSFPVFYDTQASAAKAFNVYSIPHTVFIRSDGTVEKTYVGAISEETIRTHIEKISEYIETE